MMPDDQRQGSKVYCLSLRPRERRSVVEALTARGTVSQSAAAYPRSAKGRRYSVCACRPRKDTPPHGVLQLACAAPRVKGAALMPDGQRQGSKANTVPRSAADCPRSAKGERCTVCACQGAECCSSFAQRQGSKVQR